MKATFKPIDYDSDQVSVFGMHMNDRVLLLICIYMNCNNKRLNHILVEYIIKVLNYIEIICNMTQTNYVCIGGDLITDLMRMFIAQPRVSYIC